MNFSIKAIFSAQDNMSAPLKNIETSLKQTGGVGAFFSNKFKNDIAKAEKKMAEFGQSVKQWGSMAMQQGLREAGAFFKDSVQKYIDFEDSITQAGAKFSDLDVTSSDFTQHLKEMQNAAMKVGAETKFSATDAAGALDKMAMAGIKSQDAMSMLRGTADLAAATNLDLTSAVDMATDAMGAFKISGNEDAFGKLAQWNGFEGIAANVNHVADVVSKATNLANLDMNMWFDSVKNGAATFTSFGGTMEQFTGMAMALANAGIKGGDAGTALRNVMLKLGAPTSTAAKALDELGIGIYESDGSMRNIMKIMADFETKLAGISGEKKNNLLNDIFGARSVGSFLTLMNAGTDAINGYIEALENSQGTAGNVAKTMNQSIKGQITLLGSAIEGIKLDIGRAFADSGGSANLQKIIEAIQGIKKEQLVAFVSGLTQAVAGFVVKLVAVAGWIWKMRDYLMPVIVALGVYKLVCFGVAIAQSVMLSPILAVIAVMTLLSIGIVAVIKHWEQWKNVIIGIGAVLLGVFSPGLLLIGGFIALIVQLVKHWDLVKAKLLEIGQIFADFFVWVGQGIMTAFVKFGSFMKEMIVTIFYPFLALLQGVTFLLSKLPGVGGVFGKINSGIAGLTGWNGEKGESGTGTGANQGVIKQEPITQGDRFAYSETRQISQTEIRLGLDKGLNATTPTGLPPTVKLARSGAF